MVKFVAKSIAVDTRDLAELPPPHVVVGHAIGFDAKGKNGFVNTIKITQDGAPKYKLTKLEIKQNKLDTYFKGDFEPKLFKGDDDIKGSSRPDALFGYDGNDTIYGRAGGDIVNGGKGNDLINGGAGVNTATGAAGEDTFLFDTVLAAGNYTDITDFKPGTDKMQLDKGIFDGIGPKGKLAGSKFFLADEYEGKKGVIYEEDTGTLLYSKSGGDISGAVAFGHVGLGVELSNKDFLIA